MDIMPGKCLLHHAVLLDARLALKAGIDHGDFPVIVITRQIDAVQFGLWEMLLQGSG